MRILQSFLCMRVQQHYKGLDRQVRGVRAGRRVGLLVHSTKNTAADVAEFHRGCQVVRGCLRQRHELPAGEGLSLLLQSSHTAIVPIR